MFTGIAHGKYRSKVNRRRDGVIELELLLGDYGKSLVVGASVAVNGVCLTVVDVSTEAARFEIGRETARISNLGELTDDSYVNVERSYRVGDEIGGHILSGHVAEVATTTSISFNGSEALLEVVVPAAWRPYVMPKGFIALNGCSLTVAEYDRSRGVASINLIPETLRRTNLVTVECGSRLNLEVDSQTQAIVDTVRDMLNNKHWMADL